MKELDFQNIYNKLKESDETLEKDEIEVSEEVEKAKDETSEENKEEPKEEKDTDFLSQWKKVKDNNKAVLEEFKELQSDKDLQKYASQNRALNKALLSVGKVLVGLSALAGLALKAFNFFIPGAESVVGIAAKALSPVRVGGQALINANSKIKGANRIAPATQRISDR